MAKTLPVHLTTIQPLRSLGGLLMDWLLIGVCFWIAMHWPHPVVTILAAVIIARTQLALAVLMHESAHGLLVRDRRINDVVGQIFTAAPLMLSLFSYRRGHLQHHRAPMASDDPVARVFGIADYPVARKILVWRLLKDITGIAYLQSVHQLMTDKPRAVAASAEPKKKSTGFVIASVLAVNSIMFGTLAAAGHPQLYLYLWILPALTFLQVFARVRAITEHAGYPPCADQTLNARTIVRPSWQTFFFGPHAIHYHIEHHQHVRVPFYRLQEVHRTMKARGCLPDRNLYRGYGNVLKDVTTPVGAAE